MSAAVSLGDTPTHPVSEPVWLVAQRVSDMFRHGWPQSRRGDSDLDQQRSAGKPDLAQAWQRVWRQLGAAAAQAPAQALEAAAGAVQQLQREFSAAAGQQANGSGRQQLALASLSGAMLQRQQEPGR